MLHGIPIHARVSALRFLRSFPRATAQRGENYFARGAVRNIKASSAGIGFSAEVNGTQVYHAALDYDEAADAWECDCDCPVGDLCKHGYALMKTLLDRASPDKITESPSLSETRASSLMNELSTALGRKLEPEEITFLRRLEKAFAQAKTSGGVYIKDLATLGWRVPGFHWDRLALWPSFPADEREFWLYLVLFLEGHGLKLPEFMSPISNPGPLRERVATWRRSREIERWRKLLSRLREGPDTAAPLGELDLRLRFRPGEAVVEARRGEGEFEPMKAAAFRELPNLPPDALTHEAALLAHFLHARAGYGYSPAVPYREQAAADLLGELLRLPWLESRLVGESGTALARPADPLRWQLDPAADEAGDYRLRLVLPDGRAAGPFHFVVEGTPTLYLTNDAVFKGPIIDAHALTPGEETIIPAAALETGDGVRFLRKHGVELPTRLRERIRTVTVKPLLRCELQPTYPGAQEETCVVQALGGSEDGSVQLVLTRDGWQAVNAEAAPPDSLIFQDRAPLAAVPALLEQLRLKWDSYARHWHFKVTRKFAETFTNWLCNVPPEVTVELRGELASFQNDAVSGTVRLSVEESALDWFDLRVVLDVSETELTKQELKLLLDARGKWVRLGAKGWRRLEFQLSEEEDEQLSRLGLNPHDLSSEPQKLHALQLADPRREALSARGAICERATPRERTANTCHAGDSGRDPR
jgi:hypothetical protein